MFQNLTEKLDTVFRNLRNRGKLTEADIDATLREVKLALLEADVNYKVAKTVISDISGRLLSLNGKMAGNFLQNVSEIADLNYLNANVEVKYSFKGWAGLFHHFIFSQGKKQSNESDIYRRHFQLSLKEE